MKNSLLSSVSIVALTSSAFTVSAFAIELPISENQVITPPPIWTGFYAGLNAGYGWGTARTTMSESGFIGGGSSGLIMN